MNRILLSALVFLLIFPGCKPKSCYFTASRLIMDTLVEVKISGVSPEAAARGLTLAFNEFNRVDQLMSRFKPGSAVTAFNERQTANIKVDAELYQLLKQAAEISQLSGGAFDATVEPVLELYGFGSKEQKVPAEKSLWAALSTVGYEQIHFAANNTLTIDNPDTKIDLGGIAKGYALRTAAAGLEKAGINNFLIVAGGDIITHGLKSDGATWNIGIKNPRGTGIIGTLKIADTAVVTSGDYERFFMADGKRIHHIIDPKTGHSAPLCRSVTVIYPDAALADCFGTAIFVLGPEAGLKLAQNVKGLRVLIIAQDGTIVTSKGFNYEAQ